MSTDLGVTETDPSDDPIVAFMADAGADLLASLNGDFADSILLVGRVLGDRPAASAAQAQAIDGRGIDLIVTDPTGQHPTRIGFDEPVTDPGMLVTTLLGLVTVARARAGDGGEVTEAERRNQELSRIATFITSVVAVRDIHPHLREVTFGGGDLDTFTPAGPDTFLYVLLPPEGRTDLTIDQSFTWEAHAQMAEADKPVGAYYTLRRWRPETHELDILMVLHGETGPASRWASRAAVGDPVALWGPRTAYHPPPGTDRLVLVADETGLPAVAVILESLPEGWTAQVLAEVADESERQDLPTGAGIDIAWYHRDGAEPGTTTLLADAAAALNHPGGTPYVWGGGESRTMTAVRRRVRDGWGLDRAAVSLVAYWRHAASPVDEG